jgi:cysteine protease ATG4
MIEGGGNTNGHPSSLGTVPVPVPMMGITNGGISLTRASVDMVRPLDNPPTGGESASAMFDSQMTEVPAERKSHKGRSLAKKTSQLFNWRERDRSEADHTSMTPSSQSSLNLPGGSRQASYSSTTSSETSTSNSHSNSNSAGRHFPSLTRPLSHHSRTKHSRRPSQDSQSSWQGAGVGPGAPKSTRSGSTSTYESPVDLNGGSSSLPIPRRLPSHMSASVPSLSRNALPQPAPQSSTSNQSSIPSRMSSWFSNLLPSSAPTTESPLPPTDPAGSSYSPSRRGPSAAANFLYSARQKAVDGVRNLLDSEAQPDRCADTIWVMGVGHPGYRPSTPRNASATDLPELGEEAQARRGSGSSGRPSPPARGDTGGLRPSAWPRKADVASQSGNGPTSPPNNGFGQLFTPSTLSLTAGSPSKDTESKAVAGESPGKMKKDRKDKEVLKWPEQCRCPELSSIALTTEEDSC